MNIGAGTKANIQKVILDFMDDVIHRKVVVEPSEAVKFGEDRPFHNALVPEEIWKASTFERSFVTSLGMIGWEKIAKYIAEENLGFAENKYEVTGKVYRGELQVIQNILDELEHKIPGRERVPSWEQEISEIEGTPKDEIVEVEVISDLFAKATNGETFYFEIKSSKPNSDQTKVSKEKMLKIYAMKKAESPNIYFALPDNPWKVREKYSHPHPMRWFDMRHEKVVLIGKEMWDLLGGPGTYEELIGIFQEVGKVTKERIRKEILNL